MQILHCFDELYEEVASNVFTELLPSSDVANHVTSRTQLNDDDVMFLSFKYFIQLDYTLMIDLLEKSYLIVNLLFVITFAFLKSFLGHGFHCYEHVCQTMQAKMHFTISSFSKHFTYFVILQILLIIFITILLFFTRTYI